MKNKSANFDLNLLPIISLLAVLISFLLLTTTWVHISSLNVKQSIGDQSTKENAQVDQEKLWVELSDSHHLQFWIKKNEKVLRSGQVSIAKGLVPFGNLAALAQSWREQFPELKQAFVKPNWKTAYQELISVVDTLKGAQITEIGITPLTTR